MVNPTAPSMSDTDTGKFAVLMLSCMVLPDIVTPASGVESIEAIQNADVLVPPASDAVCTCHESGF